MKLFDLLRALDSEIDPARCKIHLACSNGINDPLEVFLAGDFDEWQSWQTKRNFERPLVLSLIALPQPAQWLFAGVHDAVGSEQGGCGFRYELRRRDATDEFDGRLVVSFKRPGRQSYLLAERWATQLAIVEIKPERMRISEFRGYSRTLLTKSQLDIVVRQAIHSWRAALSAVSGIYLISDRATGKLYVGSATAGEGMWSRWCAYSATGHGGNIELKDLLDREGSEYAENFQFSILEIADTHASQDDVLERETYWKQMLISRKPHGYNAN